MFRLFRIIALIEGVTTVSLFFIAMPAKYWLGYPDLVPPVGMIHGWAFILYLVAMVAALWGRGFTVWEWVRTTLASFVPLGTFLNDPFLARKEAEIRRPA